MCVVFFFGVDFFFVVVLFFVVVPFFFAVDGLPLADGSVLMVGGRYYSSGGTNVWVQPIDGSAAAQLTQFTDGRTLGNFAWSRDGQRLAVSRATFTTDIVLFRGLQAK